MRWSLILSAFITVHSALSFVCLARAIPLSTSQLERRAPAGAKASSKTYRKNAKEHDYAYKFGPDGVTRTKLTPGERSTYGAKALMLPKTDADHVYEVQLLNSHLKNNGLEFNKLKPEFQDKVKGIINGPKNMAPVPAEVNRSKGQLMKNGIAGKAIAPNKNRDDYTLLSYGTARKTAKDLDKAFKDEGHKLNAGSFHGALRNAMNNAKLMDPKKPSPAGSDAGSVNSKPTGPRRSPRIASKRVKVTMPPPRKSARIAAAAAAKKQ